MTMPVLFEFETLPERVVTAEDSEYWFCRKDICEVLGYEREDALLDLEEAVRVAFYSPDDDDEDRAALLA